MTLLSIVQAVAKNAGIEVPTSITSKDPDHVKLVQFVNEAGLELARRVDWGVLRRTTTITGSGTSGAVDLPTDFDRLTVGMSVVSGIHAVRGSLTPDEWLSLQPVEGTPRYFHLRGQQICFYPYPGTDASVRIQYQSRNWAVSNSNPTDVLTLGDDVAVISSRLIETGALWRWRRHVGKDFSDYLSEFEAQLVDLARADSGTRLP